MWYGNEYIQLFQAMPFTVKDLKENLLQKKKREILNAGSTKR